jgi:hypothetical protein
MTDNYPLLLWLTPHIQLGAILGAEFAREKKWL